MKGTGMTETFAEHGAPCNPTPSRRFGLKRPGEWWGSMHMSLYLWCASLSVRLHLWS